MGTPKPVFELVFSHVNGYVALHPKKEFNTIEAQYSMHSLREYNRRGGFPTMRGKLPRLPTRLFDELLAHAMPLTSVTHHFDNQWKMHGVLVKDCYIDYFTEYLRLSRDFNEDNLIGRHLKNHGILDGDNYQARGIHDALRGLFGVSVCVAAHELGNYKVLFEIRICLDQNLIPMDCIQRFKGCTGNEFITLLGKTEEDLQTLSDNEEENSGIQRQLDLEGTGNSRAKKPPAGRGKGSSGWKMLRRMKLWTRPWVRLVVNAQRRKRTKASEHAFKGILTNLPKPSGGKFGKFYSLPALNDPRIGIQRQLDLEGTGNSRAKKPPAGRGKGSSGWKMLRRMKLWTRPWVRLVVNAQRRKRTKGSGVGVGDSERA